MRSIRDILKIFWVAVATVLVCGHLSAAQFAPPPPPLWNFAARSADNSIVLVIFSKDFVTFEGEGPFPLDQYVVERSDSIDFTDVTTLAGPYVDGGTSYLAIDQGFTDGNRPYYRVRIDSKTGVELASSLPREAIDQAGNTFVVNGFPTTPDTPCGDLAGNPCSDIKAALATAAAGSTIYVTPGIYSGAGNTNLDYNGKAITVESTNGYDVTMINCTDPVTGKKSRAFNFNKGEGRDSVLVGMTMASGASDAGGCMSITGAAPTIRDSMFLACNATTGVSRGGAIYANANPAPGPLIQNTQFIFNWGVEGAAIFVGGESQITIEGSFFEWGICPTATGRGGAVCAVLANITVTDSIMRNGIVGFGGGGIMLERGVAQISNLEAYNNTAGNFGGAFLLFGAEMKITGSSITGNRGNIFAGGVIVTSSIYDATDTIHNDNYGRVGGGGIKIVGGQLKMKGCQVNGNTATYGGGFDIAKQGDLSTLVTTILVEDTEVLNNVVPDRGGGFYLDSFDDAVFRNVKFQNNTATKGGGGWCVSATQSSFINSTFEENTAQMGGGIFADEPCRMNLDGAIFRRNTAVEAGAGLATGDGVALTIARTLFESNGVSDCKTTKPPASGGGMMVGVEQFQINSQCGAITSTIPTNVTITDSTFVGNMARTKGGGIIVESGNLMMDGVEIEGNKALGNEDGGEGVGGGVAVIERCTPGAPCSSAIAKIQKSRVIENSAFSAGGGLHFAGSSKTGGLTVSNSNFSSNAVLMKSEDGVSKDGVGGGIFVGRNNFTLSDVVLSGNEAFYGGAIFFSADLNTATARLSKLNTNNNKANMGPSAFWLRSASPNAALPLTAFSNSDSTKEGAVATEVLEAAYNSPPPSTVQSSEDVATFSVSLLDYYGNVGLAELGTCAVTAPPNIASADGSSNNAVTVRPLGSDVGVSRGGAVFSQLEVTGTIGNSYELMVDCTPNSLGRSRFLNLTGKSLPPLALPVKVSPCTPGKEPKSTGSGSICVDCPYNSFNVDGEACLPCPDGALCPGGDQISSQPNWWRSNLTSEAFYSCRTPEICLAGPVAGDEACIEGHEGPLCAVCREDWFQFAGKCESCNSTGQAKAMLAISIILFISIVVLIFVRSWEFGVPGTPGIMTKIKILITHFQLMALFRDYDVLWPSATANGFSWFDTFNIGLAMMAPECFMTDYSFWSRWIFQMLLPVGAVGLCAAIYFGADWEIKRRDDKMLLEKGGKNEKKCAGSVSIFVSSISPEDGLHTPAAATTAGSPIRSPPLTEPALIETQDKNAARQKKIYDYLLGLRIRCWKNAFWLVTLLYPRASMTALQMFGTQTMDIGTYLTADYSIQIKPPGGSYTAIYIRYMVPGAIMLIAFAIGIPALWFYVTWKNRHQLDDPVVAKKYGFLYGSYKRTIPFWETVETLRKFSLAFIPVFIPPNSVGSVQGTVGQIVSLGFLVVYLWIRPYARSDDNILAIASQIVLYLVLLSGCTAKWAEISKHGLKGLAAAQLLLSSAIAFAIITMLVLGSMKWNNKRKEKKADRASIGSVGSDGENTTGVSMKKRFSSFFNGSVKTDNSNGTPTQNSEDIHTLPLNTGLAEEFQQQQQRTCFGGSLTRMAPWNCVRGNHLVADDAPANADDETPTGMNPSDRDHSFQLTQQR
ncbi:hypothetical protein Ndes2526B_g00925 [Nannochloris sp. 'desiccata']